jgi:hypothetical protein
MRRALSGLSAALLVLAVTGCTNDPPTADPSPSPVQSEGVEPTLKPPKAPKPKGPLKFRVVGSCTSTEGTLTSVSSGFTPSGPYNTEAWYPSGTPYTMIDNPGYASSRGSTPNWSWPCALGANNKGDPPGTYKLKVTDLTTGKSVRTTLTVGKP